jgi:hypothetical protein
MLSHKFHLGQLVQLIPSISRNVPGRFNPAIPPTLSFANPTPASIAISTFSFVQIRRLARLCLRPTRHVG